MELVVARAETEDWTGKTSTYQGRGPNEGRRCPTEQARTSRRATARGTSDAPLARPQGAIRARSWLHTAGPAQQARSPDAPPLVGTDCKNPSRLRVEYVSHQRHAFPID